MAWYGQRITVKASRQTLPGTAVRYWSNAKIDASLRNGSEPRDYVKGTQDGTSTPPGCSFHPFGQCACSAPEWHSPADTAGSPGIPDIAVDTMGHALPPGSRPVQAFGTHRSALGEDASRFVSLTAESSRTLPSPKRAHAVAFRGAVLALMHAHPETYPSYQSAARVVIRRTRNGHRRWHVVDYLNPEATH
jgi:hypothetical protein